jgi:stage II sporulation protein D
MAGARVFRRLHRRLATRHGAAVATVCALLAIVVAGLAVGACRTTGGPVDAEAGGAGFEPEMRVRLTRTAERVALDADGPIVLTPMGAPNAPSVRVSPPIELRVDAGAVVAVEVVTNARAVERTIALSGAPIVAVDGTGGPVRVEGVPHAGALEAMARISSGREGIDLIEAIPIEQYIAGVLTSELYAGWGEATYEAQAIAARSYALHERGRRMRQGDHFHVESTTQDQAYAGDRATPQAKRAAQATRGTVLTFRDHILRAYYSSTCGGRAGSARDTWPVGPGFGFNLDAPIQAHERSCPCDFSPRHRWTIERPRAELARRFAAWGRENGRPIRRLESVGTITPARRNVVGRPASYTVTDEKGVAFTLSAEELRLACNTGASGVPEITPETRVLSGDLVFVFKGDTATIEGRGFGHGVGMCQFGAEGLARQGRTARDIVQHYYRGAAIERAY